MECMSQDMNKKRVWSIGHFFIKGDVKNTVPNLGAQLNDAQRPGGGAGGEGDSTMEKVRYLQGCRGYQSGG